MDDYHSQFEIDRNDSAKLKSIKKPTEKFFINETIYETEDVENMDDDDFLMTDEVETKRYKCSSPRRRHCSLKSPESDVDSDDCETASSLERTMPVDMPTSHRHTRTYSNSSETDE